MVMYITVNTTLLPYTHRPRLLASGDANGVVKVWRLNTELTSGNDLSGTIFSINVIKISSIQKQSTTNYFT